MKATVRYGFTPQSSTVVPDNNCWPGSGEISSLLQRSHKHKRCSQLETRLIVSQVVIHRATPNPAAHSRDQHKLSRKLFMGVLFKKTKVERT